MVTAAPILERLECRRLLAVSTDPLVARQWVLEALNTADAWDVTTGNPAVVVAVLDTGIDYLHDDLRQNIWINQGEIPPAAREAIVDTDADGLISFRDLNDDANAGLVTDGNDNGVIDGADLLQSIANGGWADGVNGVGFAGDVYVDDIIGWDFANNDNNPYDYAGHGTHVAGIIGADGDNGVGGSGVAWETSLAAIKIFNDAGTSATSAAVATAIRYAADLGARVANNSWGSTGYSTVLYNAIQYANERDLLMVFAAGNDGKPIDSTTYNAYPAEYNLPNIISVGASMRTGETASFSNYGTASVDLLAPGSGILSTWTGNRYGTASGTSMATPFVAGTAALMLAQDNTLTAAQLKDNLLRDVTTSPGESRYDTATGGLLNTARAASLNLPMPSLSDVLANANPPAVYGPIPYAYTTALFGEVTPLTDTNAFSNVRITDDIFM